MSAVPDKPLISIGMPVHNGEKYLREALDSLLAQDYENFELIISDNASSDRSEELCRDYAARDRRIRYHRNAQNIGAVKNLYRLRDLACGRYFMWAADHDLWHPTFISRCARVLDENPGVVLCYARTQLVAADGQPLGLMEDQIDTRHLSTAVDRYRYLLWRIGWCNMVYGLFRAEALKALRQVRPVFGADNALLAEVALRGDIAQLPDALYFRRKNREDEDYETRKRRTLTALDPARKVKAARNYAELYRDLAGEFVAAVWHAPLALREKFALVPMALYCCATRWEMWGPTVARLAHRLKPALKRVILVGLAVPSQELA